MPLEVDIALTAAVFAEGSLAGVRTWSRQALLTSAQDPLLQPIVDGVVRLFGLSPSSLLKRAPLVWNQIYRDCGVLRVEQPEKNVVTAIVGDAPRLIADDVGYLEGTAGAFEAVLEL